MKAKKAISVLVLCGVLFNGACVPAHASYIELLSSILGTAIAAGAGYIAGKISSKKPEAEKAPEPTAEEAEPTIEEPDYFTSPNISSNYEQITGNEDIKVFLNKNAVEHFEKTYITGKKGLIFKKDISETYNLSRTTVILVHSKSFTEANNLASQRAYITYVAEPSSQKLVVADGVFFDDEGYLLEESRKKTDFDLDKCNWKEIEPAEEGTIGYTIVKNMAE